LSGLIERRVLYRFISRDTTFDLTNPARFEECIGQWQALTTEKASLIHNAVDVARLKELLCQKSILTQYLKEKVVTSVEVAEPEIVEYFEAHKADFALPERVVVRQIVLVDDRSAAKIKNQATKDNFSDLARANSITPEAEKGGLLGPFARGELPRVFDVAFDLPVGAISQVQKSPYGFHIFMPVKKLPPQTMTLEDSRAKIRSILVREKESQEYSKWVERALASVPVTTGAEKL
jgi:parvulin-like peptidyl-prolyl isomerase